MIFGAELILKLSLGYRRSRLRIQKPRRAACCKSYDQAAPT